jgi:UDPglucose--hexose-1-phosphate uridylyltransferase
MTVGDKLNIASEGLALRWNPALEEWIVVAPDRQERTFLPPDEYCPLCPTRDEKWPTEIPAANYELAVFENRFPSFARRAPKPARVREPYTAATALGAAEVVVYSPEHGVALGELPVSSIVHLIEVWTDRYEDLAARHDVKYVMLFENRGQEIGVTLTHPHGQIYAFPFVPPVPARELQASARYRRQHGTCLHCDVVRAELKDGRRLVLKDESFVAVVPYYARFPYEVHVVSRKHRGAITDLTEAERRDLAEALRAILQKYDTLWSRPMPFVMAVHQKPTDGKRYPGCHFHIEFMPGYREREKMKYLAGSEVGAGVFINDTRAEETAEELRAAEPGT